jgi:hypothetical protein
MGGNYESNAEKGQENGGIGQPSHCISIQSQAEKGKKKIDYQEGNRMEPKIDTTSGGPWRPSLTHQRPWMASPRERNTLPLACWHARPPL